MWNPFKRNSTLAVLESTRQGNALRKGNVRIPLTARAEHAIIGVAVHGGTRTFTDGNGKPWTVHALTNGTLRFRATLEVQEITLSATEANTVLETLKDTVRGELPSPLSKAR